MKTRQLARWTAALLALMALPLASGAAPAPVPRTGQTVSYRSGDDGDLQPGVAWPSPRFKDHGNGTVTDRLTGLMWSRNAFPDGVKTNWSGLSPDFPAPRFYPSKSKHICVESTDSGSSKESRHRRPLEKTRASPSDMA